MDKPVIDGTVYAELRSTTGSEFVTELVDTFLDEAPRILSELRSSLAGGNAERFRRAAHSLKSNGSTFGALQLAELARELELKGLDTEPGRDAAALTELEAVYSRAAAELKALCHG